MIHGGVKLITMLKSPLSLFIESRKAAECWQVIKTPCASGLSPEREWTLLQPGVRDRSDYILTESWLRERARQPDVPTRQ